MPDERTPSQIADEHDALRPYAYEHPYGWRKDFLLMLANDDAAMCAAVRALEAENARLRAVIADACDHLDSGRPVRAEEVLHEWNVDWVRCGAGECDGCGGRGLVPRNALAPEAPQ